MSLSPGAAQVAAALLLILILFVSNVTSQAGCNSNNPYCAGVAAFSKLCCPYPSVCYYSDRYGGVGCCPPGQNCQQNNAGGTTVNSQPTVTITSYQTQSSNTQSHYTTTYVTTTNQQPTTIYTTQQPQPQTTVVVTSNQPAPAPSPTTNIVTVLQNTGAVTVVTTDFSVIATAATGAFATVSGVLVGAASRAVPFWLLPISSALVLLACVNL